MSDARVLTGLGGDLEVSSSFRDVLAYLDNGTLLVSKQRADDPLVSSFQARLTLKGRNFTIELVDGESLRRIYDAGSVSSVAEGVSQTKIRDTEMMRSANELLKQAVHVCASDIHIVASKRDGSLIQMRVQGAIEDYSRETFEYGRQLCRTYYQALSDGASTYNETVPQDARIGDVARLPAGLDGVRIGTTPLADGSYMVLRLLYDAAVANDLEDMGFSKKQVASINLMKSRPSGINILSGPTGSGKSTSLQEILSQIIDESVGEKNIITVEDPVEYPIRGKKTGKYAKQSSVASASTEDERSIAMQQSIRAAMRLDPDIIMIGETRDTPSSQLSFRAAMTGHQVWTTLHANSAMSVFDRLIDMGIPLSLASDSNLVSGIVFQRLVKRLCPKCKIRFEDAVQQGNVDKRHLARLQDVIQIDRAYIAKHDGCPNCKNKGTTGRTLVVEVVIPDDRLMRHIKNGDRIAAIEHWREQGGQTVIDHTIQKVNQGLIDPIMAENQVGPLTMSKILRDYTISSGEISDAT